MSVKPITPKEVVGKKQKALPDEVIEAFNELIAENWNGSDASFLQKKVIKKIQQKVGAGVVSGQDICDKGWLDVESVFKKAGWNVEYDGPGFNETYAASFTFKKKRKK